MNFYYLVLNLVDGRSFDLPSDSPGQVLGGSSRCCELSLNLTLSSGIVD